MRQLCKFALLAAITFLVTAPAEASFLSGQTIQTTYLFPNTSTIFSGPVNSVVGPGIELANFAGLFTTDFSDNTILLTATRNANINSVPFDGVEFADVNGTISPFTSVALGAATTYSGLNASRISFDADHIFLNIVGLPGLRGQVIELDLNSTSQVPEPGTLFLSAAGLALFLVYRSRRLEQQA